MTPDAQPGLVFTAYGKPATKGSLKPVRLRNSRRIRLIEDHESSQPWRETVKYAALSAIRASRLHAAPFTRLEGPVEADVIFCFDKPKSAPKTRLIWPITRSSGDIDKLLRNVFDALVDAGAIADDSQIVKVTAEKAHVGDYPAPLPVPGARVIVRTLIAARRLT